MKNGFGLATAMYNERDKVIIHVWTDCEIIVQCLCIFGPRSSDMYL